MNKHHGGMWMRIIVRGVWTLAACAAVWQTGPGAAADDGASKADEKAITCDGVRYEVRVSPSPAEPGAALTFSIEARDAGTNQYLRINRAAWYFNPTTVANYKVYLADPTKPKPQPDRIVTNPAPPGVIAALPSATGNAPNQVGAYDVLVEVQTVLADGVTVSTCAPPTLIFASYMQVFTTPAADFEAKDYISGNQYMLPAGDWIPLFGFNMKYNKQDPAPRALTKLIFTLKADPNQGGTTAPTEQDFQEFALFRFPGALPDNADTVRSLIAVGSASEAEVDTANSRYRFARWDNKGWPYEMPVNQPVSPDEGRVTGPNGLVYQINDANYRLNFTLDTTNPLFPVGEVDQVQGFSNNGPKRGATPIVPERDWVVAGPGDGYSYVVCVRLSASWPAGRSLIYQLDRALMQPYVYDFGTNNWVLFAAPINDQGEFVDRYNPNFYAPVPEPLIPDGAILGYFDIFDPRGGGGFRQRKNSWNEQVTMYTPVPGFTRPRWDISNTALNFVGGELMDLRQLFSVESWTVALAINAKGSYLYDQPTDIHLIFTDIGADPYSYPGNGGFDPRTGFETFTLKQQSGADSAIGEDYAFNGVWLWHDTNVNGIFDPPVPNGTTGITFVDYPMIPMRGFTGSDVQLVNYGNHEWQYEPFPPGGGDPWWKIQISLGTIGNSNGSDSLGGRRRAPAATPRGYTTDPEHQSDSDKVVNYPNYFVVFHSDSGFTDVSGLPGDGTGINLGADFRVFIEPRRWDPRDGGHWTGGILFWSQATALARKIFEGTAEGYPGKANEQPMSGLFWQNYTEWTRVCPPGVIPCENNEVYDFPFWNERFHGVETAKPIRCGVEIHDLVLTYSTSNRYGKITPIMAGQQWRRFFPDLVDRYNGATGRGNSRTMLSIWTDPAFIDPELYDTGIPGLPPINSTPFQLSDLTDYFGILEWRSITLGRFNLGVTADLSAFPPTLYDSLTDIQFAFETVPFALYRDNVDAQLRDPRSTFFPNPPQQPTLPRYPTWSGYQEGAACVAWGLNSRCWLENDGGDNVPFYVPGPAMPGEPIAEKTYENDVYVFEVNDLRYPDSGLPANLAGKWLIDRYGGRYYIESNSGNLLTLRKGHGAYLDAGVNVPDYPYGVPVGQAFSVDRGHWMIVEDTLLKGTYPRLEDWTPEKLLDDSKAWAARLLRQRVTPGFMPLAMLGVNVCGVSDPAVLASRPLYLTGITVAFWGPEFTPDQLASLDPNGELFASGLLLYEDTNQNGVFDGPVFSDLSPVPAFTDRIVPLETGTLRWPENPEPIDLNGDYEPDDLSGDGVVFLGDPEDPDDVAQLTPQQQAAWDGLSDLAWVVQLFPRDNWPIPSRDARLDGTNDTKSEEQAVSLADWPSFWTRAPQLIDFPVGGEKALSVSGRNGGDDLFVVVRPSENMKAHSEFRALVPAKLPSRTPENAQIAGVQIMPRAYSVVDTETKRSPEEGAVQDFYGHDMLAADVYARILDATSSMQQSAGGPVIQPGGLEAAVLGIDMSVNRPENVVARGTTGQVGSNTFTVVDADVRTNSEAPGYYNNGWSNQTIGCYLIGLSQGDLNAARVEAYQIVGVNGRQLQLRAGAPRGDRPWYVVKDPSFLETLTVEFYDVGNSGKFDLVNDFLPLNIEDPVNGKFSGVAVYRDNDWDPRNRNGVFDPPIRDANGNITEYIDLPLRLDGPPVFIGTVGGEPEYQVRFSFAKPGTDNLVGRNTVTYESQDRNRQWIPNTIGLSPTDPDYGADFFVVVRASTRMSQGDQFQAGIVSWGPNTPTEPDPDNFMPVLNSGSLQIPPDQFDIFSEFPWGNRGLGVITLFRDPLPVYYWGYDKLRRRVIPRRDVDRSQQGQDFATLRNWLRTNPYIWGRSSTVTSLAPPRIDFVGVPTRQRVGGDVTFTLSGAVQIARVVWDFGDGTTSTEINPVHQYAAEGKYTVKVTVTNVYGVNTTVRKVDYIEILSTPYADFTGTPVRGNITPGTPQPNLTVTFTDGSVAGEGCQIVGWFWNFGDGATSTEQNPSHQYTTPGIYDVTLQVTFQCGTETIVRTLRRTAYVTVLECIGCDDPGGGGGTDVPSADISFESKVRDKEALLPLSDWVPLFRFTMSYGEEPENYAPRVLRTLTYLLRVDDRDSAELNYMNSSGPHPTDLLEFGLFLESKASDEAEENYKRTLNGELDPYYDRLLFTWDNTGAPVGSIVAVQDRYGVAYKLNFIGNGTAANPQFRVDAGPNTEDSLDGKSYIVAVRTSATWRSQLTMGVEVLNAEMIDPRTGGRPVDEEGKPIDSYSPDFFGDTPETLKADAFYSSSFTVYDYYGTPSGGRAVQFANAWNFSPFLYSPLNEQSRPRWNSPNQLLDVVAGEILQLRKLVSLDEWISVLGINVHSTSTVHFNDSEVPRYYDDYKDRALLREVNVVLTDIGADPYGPPGNGGFDPRNGLERITVNTWGLPIIDEEAKGDDLTYNGIWIWHDTNNNGLFDPPTPNPEGGITFNGDYPMLPATKFLTGEQPPVWEYIPFPPGGGDPWWKISLRLWGGTRKNANIDNRVNRDFTEGYVETVPDNHGPYRFDSEFSPDYFVVIRTDSGYRDVSLLPGDNTGITYGADFKAFIEPRRFDPQKRRTVGGIFVDSQIPAQGVQYGDQILSPWQNDSRWLPNEPWWPQRTFNQYTAKDFKVGLDIHDLVITYETDSPYASRSDLFYTPLLNFQNLATVDTSKLTIGGYTNIGVGEPSGFSRWTDPFGLEQRQFQNGHVPDVNEWRLFFGDTINLGGNFTISLLLDDSRSYGQFAFETAPFFNTSTQFGDVPPVGPRSSAYPSPPQLPALPSYDNWSRELKPGELPRLSQWRPADIGARLLTQKTETNGSHEAMLGINLASSVDPLVAAGQPVAVASITVALWGPGFTPDMLKPLDPDSNDNTSLKSGLLLWEDADGNGLFFNTEDLAGYPEDNTPLPLLDRIVPVSGLKWPSQPELVDLDGDGAPDDMDGNGLVDDNDRAWVVTLYPRNNWIVPRADGIGNLVNQTITQKSADDNAGAGTLVDLLPVANISVTGGTGEEKALDPGTAQAGDDLFISVALSEKAPRFQQFRAVIPATLPTRPENQRKAGIQFFPQVNTSATAFVKSNPDEDPVQDFYGHDMMVTNVPLRLNDMTNRRADLDIAGAAVPVLGLDMASGKNTVVASGRDGYGVANGFRVPGASWTVNAYAGDFLIDERYESYEIVSNSANELSLLSGTPRNGRWLIVRDPTFFEECIVELYPDLPANNFNPMVDLLPLDIDQRLSGVAIYRDNDWNPNNRNGLFDPDIDIPLILDAPPRFTGQSAENIQVKFVFSTPGTDDYPVPRAQQTRNRQWIPDTFGGEATDANSGPDFFIVVRASGRMQVNDAFRAGIVGWGPNTPTEPDPDTWANLPGEDRDDFTKFREFPWAERGVGFITFFRTPPSYYYMDGARAGVRSDNSGFNWVRSHTSKKRRSGMLIARSRAIGPNSLVIESASQTNLPTQTITGEPFSLVIYGRNFGTQPVVVMSGYDVVVTAATNESISLEISTRAGQVPREPVVLLVRNPVTGEEATRSDLFTLVPGSASRRPKILSVDPPVGGKEVFPVKIRGENFDSEGGVEVYFGITRMPVTRVAQDGTEIEVAFPASGLPQPGLLDVRVRNTARNNEDVLLQGFNYKNDAVRHRKFFGLFACAPAPDRLDGASIGDGAVVLGALGLLLAAALRGRKIGTA